MIKAIIFDIDGVLLDSYEANFKFFTDLLTHFGHRSPTREEFPSLFHRPMKDIIKTLSQVEEEDEVHRMWIDAKSGVVPYPHDLLSHHHTLDEVISSLSSKFLLGVVSSRTVVSIYKPKKMLELQKYFKVAIGYEDTANHKPHPEPLLLAAERLKVLPTECVYVGDAKNDAIAAKAAGMKAIIYSKTPIAEADVNIVEFDKLKEAIDTL